MFFVKIAAVSDEGRVLFYWHFSELASFIQKLRIGIRRGSVFLFTEFIFDKPKRPLHRPEYTEKRCLDDKRQDELQLKKRGIIYFFRRVRDEKVNFQLVSRFAFYL